VSIDRAEARYTEAVGLVLDPDITLVAGSRVLPLIPELRGGRSTAGH
jgi:hypothetical protein